MGGGASEGASAQVMPISIDDTKNINTFRRRINQHLSGYGDELPDPAQSRDGRIFVVMPAKTQYQLQDGVWVAL